MLVQAEVLQKEPEQTQMTLLACSLVSLLDVVDGSWGGGGSPNQQSQQQQQQRQLGTFALGGAGLVLQKHRQVEESEERAQRGVQGHSVLHLQQNKQVNKASMRSHSARSLSQRVALSNRTRPHTQADPHGNKGSL